MLQIEYLSEYSSAYVDIYVSKALINIKDIMYITATTIAIRLMSLLELAVVSSS